MSDQSNYLAVRPEADTETVEDLVARVRKGFVRIPNFQRGLRWEARNVLELYDSVYKGYPIGALLMRKGTASAAKLELGPLRIDAPETPTALWVIDGQQRLVALTAGLARPSPVPTTPDDPYVVYFNAESQTFVAPPKSGAVTDTWVPVAELLNASGLSEWVFNWRHGQDEVLRKRVFEAGTRLRQYRIPQYVVETDDEGLLREIFFRTNNSGKPLKWPEVHDALFGHTGKQPSTLADLSKELEKLGMGQPYEELLLSCVVAFQGLDVTQTLSVHYERDTSALRRGVKDALPAIRQTLSFLRQHAEIPHLRLLPVSIPLIVLTRFFGLFSEPRPRTITLLVRWTWRTILGAAILNERTLLRRGITLVDGQDEEQAVQTLLQLVGHEPPEPFSLPERFDARSAESRLALLGLASLSPLDLESGQPIDIAALIEARDTGAFRRIWSKGPSSPANRALLPGKGVARREFESIAAKDVDSTVLRSHAITSQAAMALLNSETQEFTDVRTAEIERAVHSLGQRLASWNYSDRPSIQHLLSQTGA